MQEHDKFQHLQRSKEKKEQASEPVKPALPTASADGVAQGGHDTSGSHIGRWPGSITGTPTWAAYVPYLSASRGSCVAEVQLWIQRWRCKALATEVRLSSRCGPPGTRSEDEDDQNAEAANKSPRSYAGNGSQHGSGLGGLQQSHGPGGSQITNDSDGARLANEGVQSAVQPT